MNLSGQTGFPSQNYWASVKSFGDRGGFFNGLNPSIVGRIWYVNANSVADRADKRGPVGSDGNDGLSPFTPFATIERAFEFIATYDVIVIDGVFREQLVSPDGVYDVTIMGAAGLPRQATSSGVPTGGGASWLSPTSPVALTPLLEIKSAGWKLINFQMSPAASSACVRLTRSASVDTTDASHTLFQDMYFSGGGTAPIGIEDNGGCGFVQVLNCRFQNLTSAILSLNTAAAVPLSWYIGGNRFQQNTNDVKMSLSYAIIEKNQFMTAGSGSTNKVISTTFISTQGGNNHVTLNQFSNTAAQIQISNGYTGASSDTWANYTNNQAGLTTGQPGA